MPLSRSGWWGRRRCLKGSISAAVANSSVIAVKCPQFDSPHARGAASNPLPATVEPARWRTALNACNNFIAMSIMCSGGLGHCLLPLQDCELPLEERASLEATQAAVAAGWRRRRWNGRSIKAPSWARRRRGRKGG